MSHEQGAVLPKSRNMRRRAAVLSAALAIGPAVVPALPALRDGGASVVPRLRNASLRLRGGTDGESADALRDIRRRRAETDGDEEDANGMKAAAKRRAEQARRAGSFSSSESLSKTAYRILASATNKIGLTGSSTRVVNGQVVVRRNVVQKLFHMIYIFFRAIYFFCKTLVVPLSTLEPQNKGGSRPRRGSFASMSKSNVVRMADLPPMPGG